MSKRYMDSTLWECSWFLELQNSLKIETITTISKGCQPLPSVKDKDKDSDSSFFLNISLFESQLKKELISEYSQQALQANHLAPFRHYH